MIATVCISLLATLVAAQTTTGNTPVASTTNQNTGSTSAGLWTPIASTTNQNTGSPTTTEYNPNTGTGLWTPVASTTTNEKDSTSAGLSTPVASTTTNQNTGSTSTEANNLNAAHICTDDACCQKLEEGEQACTKCAKSTGCTFYGLFNNNVFSAGGKCVLSTTTTPPTTGYKKIEKYNQCADLCAKLACSACLEIPECKWCDTAAAVGVGSTGSCELEKCLTGVEALTECSSAATNAVAALVAVVAFIATASL